MGFRGGGRGGGGRGRGRGGFRGRGGRGGFRGGRGRGGFSRAPEKPTGPKAPAIPSVLHKEIQSRYGHANRSGGQKNSYAAQEDSDEELAAYNRQKAGLETQDSNDQDEGGRKEDPKAKYDPHHPDFRFRNMNTMMSRKQMRAQKRIEKKQGKSTHYMRLHGHVTEEPVEVPKSKEAQPKPAAPKEKKQPKREEKKPTASVLDSDDADNADDEGGFFKIDFAKFGGKKRGRVDMEEEILSDEASINGGDSDKDDDDMDDDDDDDEIPSDSLSSENEDEDDNVPASKRRRANEDGQYHVDPAALDKYERDQAADMALMKRLEKKLKKSKEPDEFDFLLKGISAGQGKLLKSTAPKSSEEYLKIKKRELEEAKEKDTEADMDELFQDFLDAEDFGRDDSDDENAAPRAEKIFLKRAQSAQKDSKKPSRFGSESGESDADSEASDDEGDMMDHESADSYYDEDDEEDGEGFFDSNEEDAESGSDVGDSNEMDSDMDSEQEFDEDNSDDGEEAAEMDDAVSEQDQMESDEAGDEAASEEEKPEEEPKTDIYGRPVGASGGAYVPPHLRRLQQGAQPKYDEKTLAMRKELRGLINRLSEPNLTKIASAIEDLLKKSSRGALSDAFAEFLVEDCVASTGAGRVFSYSLSYSAIAYILHVIVGAEIGGTLIERAARQFSERHEKREAAACKNIASLTMYLYTFRVIHHSLMYDLINIVLNRFEDNDIEILLMLVKGCGQQLRSDDPTALRDVVTAAIKRAGEQKSKPAINSSAASTATSEDVPVGLTRSDYLLELLSDLKNNKLKFQDKDVSSNIQRVKRLVDGFMRERFKTSVPPPQTLKIAWSDLVGSTSKGRWWLGGNFSVGLEPMVGKKTLAAKQEADAAQDSSLSSRFDAAVLKLAQQQRMNTDVRRAIFCVLVTSEDFQDAFANLMKLQLKNKQDREIVHVLLHCCLQEKQYNEYYSLLGDKLCQFDHNYKETFKYALWDKLKQIDELPSRSLVNLASFYSKLMVTHAVSLSVLKVVDFESLSAKGIVFFRLLFTNVFTADLETVEAVFKRIAGLPDLDKLKDGLTVFFIQSFIPKDMEKKQAALLQDVSRLARKVMKSSGSGFF